MYITFEMPLDSISEHHFHFTNLLRWHAQDRPSINKPHMLTVLHTIALNYLLHKKTTLKPCMCVDPLI